MIKWSEFTEDNVLYEAFLPEHEQETCMWLLRASSRGHILLERFLALTWPPRFGPDAGDVAALEASVDRLMNEVLQTPTPIGEGSYTPAASELSPPEPILHAMLHALVQQFAEAEDLTCRLPMPRLYLHLPVVARAAGLYPFAVTRDRDSRMNRMIALAAVLKARPDLHHLKEELLSAILVDDIPLLRRTLTAAGLDFGNA
jgi:hypothetical protein